MKFIQLLAIFTLIANQLFAQDKSSPVKLLQSEDFESPGRHEILSPIPYGEKGIIQVNNRGIKSFNFQLFTNELRFVKEKTVEPENKLSEHASNPRFVKVGSKTYLFVRDVYRDRDKEGVSCLEFNADKLDFEAKDKKLFETSDKVAYNGVYSFGGSSFEDENKISFGSYKMDISKNDKAVLFTYRLRPEKRNDKLNNDVIGMQVLTSKWKKFGVVKLRCLIQKQKWTIFHLLFQMMPKCIF